MHQLSRLHPEPRASAQAPATSFRPLREGRFQVVRRLRCLALAARRLPLRHPQLPYRDFADRWLLELAWVQPQLSLAPCVVFPRQRLPQDYQHGLPRAASAQTFLVRFDLAAADACFLRASAQMAAAPPGQLQ